MTEYDDIFREPTNAELSILFGVIVAALAACIGIGIALFIWLSS